MARRQQRRSRNRERRLRVVRFLVQEGGIDQFVDLGTGLPTADNTHEVAQGLNPGARIVYVDNDRCKSGCAHADDHRCPADTAQARFPRVATRLSEALSARPVDDHSAARSYIGS
jgi:hypothetical protein